MSEAGKPDASAVIWDWRAIPDERSRRSAARKRALIRFVVASLAGGALFYFGRSTMASVVWSAGALTLMLAVISPLGAYAALDRFVARLGGLVGVALTWLLLSPVFYLFFTPFGLLFRRGVRDSMQRRFDPRASTYWKQRDDRPNLERPF